MKSVESRSPRCFRDLAAKSRALIFEPATETIHAGPNVLAGPKVYQYALITIGVRLKNRVIVRIP